MIAQVMDVVETAELPVLEFVAPMPGFPGERRFVLVRMDDNGLLYSLTSIDQPELRFLVVPPAPFFPDYEVEVDDESLVALGLPDAEDLLILLVITAGETPVDTTANLMAPIVVAQSSRRAVQLVLGGSGLPVRAPLLGG
jgi:flagellar assembly factor FliW